MAIIKRAENITIKVKKSHKLYAKKVVEMADKVIVDATLKNLTLNSNKKIISNGRK